MTHAARAASARPGPPAAPAGPGLALAGVLGTLAAACSVGLLATSAWLISRAAQHPLVLSLMAPAAVVQAFGLGRAGLRYAERLAGHDAALRILAGLRTRAYDALALLAPAGLAEYRSGDLISRLVTDIDSLADRWLRVRLPYLAAALTGAGAVAVSAALLPAAGAVLAASLIAAAVAAPVTAVAISRQSQRRSAPLRGELAARTVDLLRGAGELAAFGAAGRALAALRETDAAVTGTTARSGYARGAGAAVTALAAGAAVWGSLVAAVPAVRSGALAGVMLAVVVLMPMAAHEVFAGLAPAAQEVPRLRSAAARVSAVLARPAPVTEPAVPAPLPGPPYGIRISGLRAQWPGGGGLCAGGPLALGGPASGARGTPGDGQPPQAGGSPGAATEPGGVSADIAAGQRVAVTGPSGSGKTTLAMVLLRFLDPSAGHVTLGGADITALGGDAVRSVVGLCAQDAHIFDSTLEANLRLARPSATAAELRGALARARLLGWADSLPLGLATPVGEHGARLSGGQRQRLALARVLLADFPVVIFDEPAEHLDEETAGALTRDLLAATAGRTVLLITHRPVEPGSVDQVLCLG